MISYIHRFKIEEEFNAQYNGWNYHEPWVSTYSNDINVVVNYNKSEYDKLLSMALMFEILSDGIVKWKCSNSSISKVIEYKKNNDEWISISSSTSGTSINVVTGDKIYFRGNNSSYANSSNYNCFECTCNFNIYGNIMSLIDGNNFYLLNTLSQNYTFKQLFYNCSKLQNASKLILPATVLSESCYESLFQNCTNLLTSPELPALNINIRSYADLFHGCSNLIIPPQRVGGGTLTTYCCVSMFSQCTNLVTTPELPSTILDKACYNYMFWECSNIIIAPILPALTLKQWCYYEMFYNCSKLNYINCLATNLSADNPLKNWLYGVSSTGKFIKSNGISWPNGSSGIPSGWTVQNAV